MVVVRAQKVPVKKIRPRQLLAELCWYYPQYTLEAARRLPARDVVLLLDRAHRQEAKNYMNLTQIAAAPSTHKGTGVKKLLKHFKKVYES